MKKYKIGFTQGTFDTFHIGHLNLIRNAKEQCEKLIVGVNTDALVQEYKHKTPIINEQERLALVKELRSVDEVILCDTLDKMNVYKFLKFDVIFIGDDWKGSERWKQTEIDLQPMGVEVVYLKHTEGISSTMVRESMKNCKVFNTGETAEDLKAKHNFEGSVLRQAQLRMLDMLIYFDRVCKEAGVQYRIQAGTVLGAVRHGGFVPWDDDVDVVVGRKDYKKLCKYLLEHPDSQYVLQCRETDPYYYNFWNVLRDTHSEYVKDDLEHNIKKFRGLQIDIFCFESGNIPILYRTTRLFSKINSRFFIGRNKFLADLIYNFQKHMLNPLFRVLSKLFGNKNQYMHCYGSTAPDYQIPKDVHLPFKPIVFEEREFLGPAKPIEFCNIRYGNYMNIPAADHRNHHQAELKIW